MCVRDLPPYIEAKSGARHKPAGGASKESLEDPFALRGRDWTALVPHADMRHSVLRLQSYLNRTLGKGVLEGVIQQLSQGQSEELLVGRHPNHRRSQLTENIV